MPRRRRDSGSPVSLFPFLSILACVIGVLTLLIAALSLGAIAVDTSGAEYVYVTQGTGELEQEKTKLEAHIVEALAVAKQLEDARVTARDLQDQLRRRKAQKEKLDARKIELLAAVQQKSQLKKNLQRDLQPLEKQVAELEEKVELREYELEPRVKVMGPRARGNEERLTPFFVECLSSSVVLNPEARGSKRQQIPESSLMSSAAYRHFLQRVRSVSRKRGIVVFLIRPGGVESFDQAYAIATYLDTRCGFLPVPSDLKIDVRHFHEQEDKPSGAGR